MIIQGSRAVGIFSSVSTSNVAPVIVRLVSTTGGAPETVTSSVICADFERLVDRRVEAGDDQDVRPGDFLEALELERHRVGADRNVRELVGARLGRHRDARHLQAGAGHRDGDARHDASGRIGDLAEDRSHALGMRRSCECQQQRDRADGAPETSGHHGSSPLEPVTGWEIVVTAR